MCSNGGANRFSFISATDCLENRVPLQGSKHYDLLIIEEFNAWGGQSNVKASFQPPQLLDLRTGSNKNQKIHE
jgi:hypothetical protein